MINLTIERMASLVRTGSIKRAFLMPHPAIDGGGWYIDTDHTDPGMSRQLHTQRGEVRTFKTADAAIAALQKAGFDGDVRVVWSAGQRAALG